MRERIRRLSWKVELVIVLGLAFGWTLPGTFHALVTPAVVARSATPPITNIAVRGTIIFELVLLGLLLPFLRLRGWTLSRLGVQPSWRGCLQGAVLALIAYGLYVGLALSVGSVWPAVAHALAETRILGGRLSWTTIVAGSIVNPFYEEILVCGYVISVLTERRTQAVVAPAKVMAQGDLESLGVARVNAIGPARAKGASLATAVNVSAAIRLSYHLYEGVAGVLSVVPLGLLFGLWFARTRRLWPLIVAHAILDFVGLAAGAG